jgi:hypothetical protein
VLLDLDIFFDIFPEIDPDLLIFYFYIGFTIILVLGPAVSAGFCHQFSGVLLSIFGILAGIFVVCVGVDLFSYLEVVWSEIPIYFLIFTGFAFIVSIPVWWWIGRWRRITTSNKSLETDG